MRRLLIPTLALLLAACAPAAEPTQAPEATLPDPSVVTVASPDPVITTEAFLQAWQNRNYEAMYAQLTPLSQEGVSFETFSERYSQFWRGAALSAIDYEIVADLVSTQAAQVRYRLTFHSSVVGDFIRETWVDLKRSDGDWRIAWSDSAILPELGAENGLALDTVTPVRSEVYDRNGLALAAQADIAAIWVVPDEITFEQEPTLLRALSRLLDASTDAIYALYEDFRFDHYHIPIGQVTVEEFRREENLLNSISGVYWRFYNGRYYTGGGVAEHAVGYVAQIQQQELERYRELGYAGDEFVGQIGIESAYENPLRGTPGGTLYLTNVSGGAQQILAERDSAPAQAIYTTIDRELQANAQQAIREFRGAIVVLERDSGAVLAMVSSPGFDPNLFNARNPNSGPGLTELFQRGGNPLLNRATHGVYPLGSVYKIITMAAGLEAGYYTPESRYVCNGEFRELGNVVLYDWTVEKERDPHGDVTLRQGLEQSCNTYFWHIGLDLYNKGLTSALPDMSRQFGLGAATGIEIGDDAGLVPDADWKQSSQGEPWGPQDAVQLAIGQSWLNVTPLQVAQFVAAVGNGGTLYRPQLIQRIESGSGVVSDLFEPMIVGNLGISPENLKAIQESMVQVVRGSNGTARRKFLGLNVDVAGKTGTAQSGVADPHAWFAGYTFEGRTDQPDIAVVVVVENSGEGSDYGAPIFRRVVESYFFGRPLTLYAWESKIGVTRTATPTPGPATLAPEPTASE